LDRIYNNVLVLHGSAFDFRQVKLASSDYNTMPRFVWREESPHEVAQRVLPAIGALVFGSFTLLVLGLLFARRGTLNF
jgi:hypothetical protein